MTVIHGCPESIEVNGQRVICSRNHSVSDYTHPPGSEFKHYGRLTLSGETETSGLTGVVETYLEIGWKTMQRIRTMEERVRQV